MELVQQEGVRLGTLETIIGPVSSDKSATLAKRLAGHAVEGRRTMGFVSALACLDGTFPPQGYEGELPFELVAVNYAADIPPKVLKEGVQIVGIDNGHFLQHGLIECVEDLIGHGCRVILASRETDFRGEAFDVIARMVVRSDGLERLFAKCRACGAPAIFSQRFRVLPDGTEAPSLRGEATHTVCLEGFRYEPRCRACHQVPSKRPS